MEEVEEEMAAKKENEDCGMSDGMTENGGNDTK